MSQFGGVGGYGMMPTADEAGFEAEWPAGRRVKRRNVSSLGTIVGWSMNPKARTKMAVRVQWDGHAQSVDMAPSLLTLLPLGTDLAALLKFKIDNPGAPVPPPVINVPGARGKGAKWDNGKAMFDLLDDDCPNALLGVVQVMTWAVDVKRYEPGSWQTVPEAIKRYGAALRRHQNAKARGERYDKESGLLHDFHIATNAVFIAELEARVDLTKAGQLSPFEYNKTLPA